MDNDTGAEPLPKTRVTDRNRDDARARVDAILQDDARSLLEHRFEERQAAALQARGGSSGGDGPWPQPRAADDFFEQGAQAANAESDQRFAGSGEPTFQRVEDDSDDDEGPYGAHYESDEEDGYRYRRKAGAGDAVAEDDYTGSAGVSAKELPWTMACNKEELQKYTCAFCKTAPAACFQAPEHLYNETYAKQQHRFPGRDAFHLNNDALDRVQFCAWKMAGTKGERKRCKEARAVCSGRPCRIRAGMIDAEAEAKWLSYTPVNQGKFNFNQRHDCAQILLRSVCKLRLVVVREAEEDSFDRKVLGRWMEAALDDLAQICYWMCIQQKYFVTAGTLLTAESDAFGLRLDDDARADLAEKMARVPARMFVALLKKHLLDIDPKWGGSELGYGPNNGARNGWYWEIMKNLLGRCWPNPLFVAYVELKVRQWIAMDCPFDAQGRPRFVLKQQRHNPLLTDFWDGPEAQSKLLAPVFEHANAIMGRLNKPSARSGYWSNAFAAIQQAMKAGGRQTQLWQVMVIARALADPMADSRANAPLVIKTKKRGKEFAVRDNSFIQKEDLDMVGCLNSAALGLRLAEAKEHALQRALPQWVLDAATAKEMTLGAYFKEELLQSLTLVRIDGNLGFAVGPKPEILDESGTRPALVNGAREKVALRMSRIAGVAGGIGKRVIGSVWRRTPTKERVYEFTGRGLLTDDPTQWTPEMEQIHTELTQSQYEAPGRAMDGVVRELVRIFDATGELPTLVTHPLKFDQLCAKEGPNTAQVLMGSANRISAAHAHFNLIRAAKGASTSANLNIMAEVTTADVLFPGQQPGQSDAAWKARTVELIDGWKSDARMMLWGKYPSQQYQDQHGKRAEFLRQRTDEYQQYRHPILRFFFAPYTPALEKQLASLDVALAQFLQDVRLPAPLRPYQVRAAAQPRRASARQPGARDTARRHGAVGGELRARRARGPRRGLAGGQGGLLYARHRPPGALRRDGAERPQGEVQRPLRKARALHPTEGAAELRGVAAEVAHRRRRAGLPPPRRAAAAPEVRGQGLPQAVGRAAPSLPAPAGSPATQGSVRR